MSIGKIKNGEKIAAEEGSNLPDFAAIHVKKYPSTILTYDCIRLGLHISFNVGVPLLPINFLRTICL